MVGARFLFGYKSWSQTQKKEKNQRTGIYNYNKKKLSTYFYWTTIGNLVGEKIHQ